MSDNDTEVHGPIDFVIIEFPAGPPGKELADAMVDLIERGTINLYDLLVVQKGEDGSVEAIELVDDTDAGHFAGFLGARSGLLGDADIEAAAEAMEPGTTAVVILYENAWARPFVAAARADGGMLIASARLTAQDVMDALDALESV
jgi:Family of unknown function (DUF6325)